MTKEEKKAMGTKGFAGNLLVSICPFYKKQEAEARRIGTSSFQFLTALQSIMQES